MSGILLCTYAFPWPERREQGLYNLELSCALRDQGHAVEIFSPSPRVPRLVSKFLPRLSDHTERPCSYFMQDLQIHAPRVPFAFPEAIRFRVAEKAPEWVSRWMTWAIRPHLLRVARSMQPEIILVHGAMPWASVGEAVAKEVGARLWVIEHSMVDVERLFHNPVLGAHYRAAWESAQGAVVVSQGLADKVQAIAPRATLACVENGASRDLSGDPEWPAEFEGKKIILSAGHYYVRKGFERLVAAFEHCASLHPDALLVLVTDPPQSLVRRVANSSAGDQIRLVPPLAHNRLLQWMATADLFAMPSTSETFGIVYAEAMLAACPVIMSADCGLADSLPLRTPGEALPGAIGWSVIPGSQSSLIGSLGEALGDTPNLQSMGLAAQELASSRFSWSRSAEELGEVLFGTC